MMKRLGYLMLVAVAVSVMGTQVRAQSATSSDVDPDAVAALNKMSTYLRSLKAYQVNAVTTRDDVLDNGQLVQYDTTISVLARAPNGLRVDINSARRQRLYLYDGKNFTVYAHRVNYYATIPAPLGLGKLADMLDEKYNIDLPLEDLFFWGTPRAKNGEITGAYDVGPAEMGGVTCEQYAFRQAGLDWQIWIQLGDYPLPKKLVITTMTDEARPQYSAILDWNLAPSFDDASFVFDPPADAKKIVMPASSTDASATTPSAESK